MARKHDEELIVALDIGTSKIAVLVGQHKGDEAVEVIGFGSHPSYGLKRGVVVNIEDTVQSISCAVESAERMAGCKINAVFTGIAGSHICSINSHGVVAIKDREVRQTDVDRVIDAAKAIAMPTDQRILHILPQEFIIDGQGGVRESLGMSGVRLEAKVHIVSGAVSAAQNITTCVERCSLGVQDIVLEQLASSYAVLTADEKQLGVMMIDIGGGTTDLAVFTEGAIRFTDVIPIAGDQVTNDVAVAFRTPTKHANAIKIAHGSLATETIDPELLFEVPTPASAKPPRQVPCYELAQVMAARYQELFELVDAKLERSGFKSRMPAGIVLTGGGSHVTGALEMAECIFNVPVRLGLARHVKGLAEVREHPSYATGVGLLLHGRSQQSLGTVVASQKTNMWSRMRSWFNGNF